MINRWYAHTENNQIRCLFTVLFETPPDTNSGLNMYQNALATGAPPYPTELTRPQTPN